MNRIITVKGTGKVSLAPDLIVVSMTLKTVDMEYDKSVQMASEHLQKLREALTGIGFAEDDLKTTNFNVCAEHESRRDEKGNYKSVFVGYACIHGLKLEFDFDNKRLSAVLTAVSDCIAEPDLNIRFTVRDKDAASDLLLKNAAENARHKAEILAAASGVALGKLVSVHYNWGELDTYSRTGVAMDRKCMAMGNGVDMSITPENIDLSDTAAFVWEIKKND